MANDHPQISDKATQQTIISIHRWTDTLLTFRTTKPENYHFVAGQYARLGLGEGNEIVWRAYSMTSAPQEPHLEFYGIVVEGGAFTSKLRGLAVGASMSIEKNVYGFMTVDRFMDGNELWMLATGTGVGPYISILRDPAVWTKFRRLILVHCVRHAAELTYQSELEELRRHPLTSSQAARLDILRLTTREARSPQRTTGNNMHGRITTLLGNGELEKRAGIPLTVETSRVMLCGNPAMIEEVRRILHSRGMRPCRRALPGQFVTENYW